MQTFDYTVSEATVGIRLDRVLSGELPEHSRTYLKELITDKCVTINGAFICKASWPVKLGDTITVTFPPPRLLGALPLPPEDIGVSIVYEHKDFLIVYKPAGLVVHAPHARSTEVTLVDWLVHSFKDLSSVGPQDRPGIVHRLDKDTSGLMIIPRNNQSHAYFSSLFQDRKIEKTYLAFVKGHPDKEGSIDYPIGRDRFQRHKMAPVLGKEALTHYTVDTYYEEGALLRLKPVTGRTHQIRVHCSAIGHSLLGDATYGSTHKHIKRHALHAHQLSFWYKECWYSFSYSLPEDMRILESRLTPIC